MIALHRRHFLATTGAVAATGVQASAPAPASMGRATPAWRILGIAPQSHKVPQLAEDYRRGVELGLAASGGSQFGMTWMAAGPLPGQPARAIAGVLHQRQADAVMGWMPPLLAAKVAPLAHSADLPLWISDAGADMARPSPPGSTMARHSLELCAVAAALADRVYAQCGPRAFLALGWHESGYDFVQAFQHRWRTLGGEIAGRHIAGAPGRPQEFDDLKQAIVSHRPDTVVALYSGTQADRFAQWWQARASVLGAELAGFPWLAEHNPELRAWTVMSWPSLNLAETAWRDRFERAGLPWTAATLLGAEAGATFGAALAGHSPGAGAHAIQAALRSRPLAGPRGSRQWAPSGSDSSGPLWDRSATQGPARLLHRAYPHLTASSAARGGWTTGYFLT
jgi:ABC-type branched-subunit amino acid transport system substrate-binding protein